MTLSADDPRREVLVSGTVDWVSLAEAVQLIGYSTVQHDPAVRREIALAVLDDLLDRGLVQVGELSPHFTPWSLDPNAAKSRLRDEWPSSDSDLSPFDGCWFSNTPKGDALVESDRPARP